MTFFFRVAPGARDGGVEQRRCFSAIARWGNFHGALLILDPQAPARSLLGAGGIAGPLVGTTRRRGSGDARALVPALVAQRTPGRRTFYHLSLFSLALVLVPSLMFCTKSALTSLARSWSHETCDVPFNEPPNGSLSPPSSIRR